MATILLNLFSSLRKSSAGISTFPRSRSTKSPLNMPTYTAAYIKDKLTKGLDAAHVEVVDESDCGCGAKFWCLVVSEKFQGKPLLQRHRLVNSILEEELKSIHAFRQKTLTPEQWKEQENHQ